MSFLENVRLRNKLVLLLIFPVLGLLYFSVNGVLEKYRLTGEMSSLQNLSALAVRISALVHETQKERGATAGFLGSGGATFGTELKGQRAETDRKIIELREFLKGFDSNRFGNEFTRTLNDGLNLLDTIEGKREAVSGLNISANEAIGYYTNMNAQFLDVIAYVAKLSSKAEITIVSTAYVNFLLGKERAGIERAIMSNTFAADKFLPGMFNRFSSLVTEQDVYTRSFLSFASNDQKDFFQK